MSTIPVSTRANFDRAKTKAPIAKVAKIKEPIAKVNQGLKEARHGKGHPDQRPMLLGSSS